MLGDILHFSVQGLAPHMVEGFAPAVDGGVGYAGGTTDGSDVQYQFWSMDLGEYGEQCTGELGGEPQVQVDQLLDLVVCYVLEALEGGFHEAAQPADVVDEDGKVDVVHNLGDAVDGGAPVR